MICIRPLYLCAFRLLLCSQMPVIAMAEVTVAMHLLTSAGTLSTQVYRYQGKQVLGRAKLKKVAEGICCAARQLASLERNAWYTIFAQLAALVSLLAVYMHQQSRCHQICLCLLTLCKCTLSYVMHIWFAPILPTYTLLITCKDRHSSSILAM